MTTTIRALTATFAFVALSAPAMAAEPVKVWKGGEGRGVKQHHLHMPLSDEEYYSDRYTAEAWFEDGTRVYMSFLVNNFGPGTGKMTVKTRWHEKNGKEHHHKAELDRGDYTVKNESPFSITASGQTLGGTPRHIKVKGSAAGYSWEMSFKSGLSPFRPGTGRTTFGAADDKYFDHTLVQPRADVSGWVKGPGGKSNVSGYGYVIHTASNMPPHGMFTHYVQIRSIDSNTVVWLNEFRTPKAYGGKRIGYLYVARDGKQLVGTPWYKVKYAAWDTDTKHANRYKVPMEIMALAKRKGGKVEVKIEADKIIGREDVLASRSGLERALIKQFAQPVNYTMSAKATVAVYEGDGEPVITTEPANYELNHMNK